jgi:hypothetical protein
MLKNKTKKIWCNKNKTKQIIFLPQTTQWAKYSFYNLKNVKINGDNDILGNIFFENKYWVIDFI